MNGEQVVIASKIVSEWKSVGISNQSRMVCPSCGPDRKKSNEKTLSITIDGGSAVYYCHHCEVAGSTKLNGAVAASPTPEAPRVERFCVSDDFNEKQVAWLTARGISREAALRCGVVSGDVYVSRRKSEVKCIGFPYVNEDGTTGTKWRDSAKNFTQTGKCSGLWRADQFKGGDLVICEGEMDTCALEEVGIFSVSVPNGAPSTEIKSDFSKKLSYLWDQKTVFQSADRIILATDSDGPGKVLSEEIARRVGKARCWRVEFPDGCKDANDVLIQKGATALIDIIKGATPWPVSGLRDAREYREDAISLYEGGFSEGVTCGVPALDNLCRVHPHTLTVVTGIPGSGKSSFLTWLSVMLVVKSDWNCAVLSAETSSQIHILQMASAYMQQPYRGDNKMSKEDLEQGLDWVEDHFVFLDESDTEIKSVLDRAQAAVLRNGVRALIIDPYNFLTGSSDGRDEGSVASINHLLVSLKTFAVEHACSVFLVAHPTKMYRQADGKVPTVGGYDISGSASFYNVADSGYTVGRGEGNYTTFTCWKARFPWLGEIGQATLEFDADTGVYRTPDFESWGNPEDEEAFNLDSN